MTDTGERLATAGKALTQVATPRDVTIVMLTWNGLEFTKRCLDSLRANTRIDGHCEVIVVDNGSTDGTPDYLSTLEWVRLIRNPRNLGFVRGNNVAIRGIPDSRDVLLLNNDMIVRQADWLDRLQAAAYSAPDVGIAGCRLLNARGDMLHAGTIMPTDSFRGFQLGSNEKDVNQYNSLRDVEGVVGACMYIRREVLTAIGPLDEAYFSYYEDTDYCLQAAKAGYRTVCAGDVTLVHVENVSTRVNRTDFSSMYDRSREVFMGRWRDTLLRTHDSHRMGVLWHSLVSFPTGYATSSKQLVLSLDRLGVDVRLAYVYGTDFMEPPDEDPRVNALKRRPKDLKLPQVLYSQGDNFCKNSGPYKIGYTMLEVTGLPRDWVDQANHMDEVWAPSTFNAETFRSSGVTRPVHVIPLGVNPDYFNPGIRGYRPTSRYTFLSVFEWGERKGPEILLRAYTREFTQKDDVLLVLKVTNTDPGVNVSQQIADLDLPKTGAPICLLYNQRLPGHQFGALYRSVDCFVLATRGEGWCMPAMEAMACGLPTIVTDWSAQHDFVNDANAYPLRVARLIPARAKCPYYEGFEWADPDEEHLRHLMRHVYEHRAEGQAKGALASREVLAKWTWDQAARKIVERLRTVG